MVIDPSSSAFDRGKKLFIARTYRDNNYFPCLNDIATVSLGWKNMLWITTRLASRVPLLKCSCQLSTFKCIKSLRSSHILNEGTIKYQTLNGEKKLLNINNDENCDLLYLSELIVFYFTPIVDGYRRSPWNTALELALWSPIMVYDVTVSDRAINLHPIKVWLGNIILNI